MSTEHKGAGYVIKDSGKRQLFKTGANRDSQENKGRFDLIPPEVAMGYSLHMEAGCLKYGDRNWEKGIPLSRYYDSCQRHLNKWWAGWKDENHLIAALWNLCCLYTTACRIKLGVLPKELDDRPRYKKPLDISPKV